MTTLQHIRTKALLAMLLLVAAAGCSRTELPATTDEPHAEGASLVIAARMPRLTAGIDPTRATLEEEEALANKKIYHATLLLINTNDGTLVAYRHLKADETTPTITLPVLKRENGEEIAFDNNPENYIDGEGIVHATFKYDAPLHEGEQLRRGRYALLAVANYSQVPPNDRETIAERLAKAIEMRGQKFDGTAEGHDLFDFTMQIPLREGVQEYIRPHKYSISTAEELKPIHIPASYAYHFDLVSGDNTVSCMLQRTCARMRFEIKNANSSSNGSESEMPLLVKDFKLNGPYRDCSYLFPHEALPNTGSCGEPDVKSTRAITPFTFNPDDEGLEIDDKHTIFDGLVYETQTDSIYTYTIEVQYIHNLGGNPPYELANQATKPDNNQTINDIASKWTHFLLVWEDQSRPPHKPLILAAGQDGANTIVTHEINRIDDRSIRETLGPAVEGGDYSMVWFLESVGGDRYRLRNEQNGDYIAAITQCGPMYPLHLNPRRGQANEFYIEKADTRFDLDSYTYIINHPGQHAYIHVETSNGKTVVCTSEDKSEKTKFRLIPIQKNLLRSRQTVELYTLDPTTQTGIPVTRIKRNDYIHVTIDVSYNDALRDFEFIAKGWDEGSGDITFE